MVDVPLHTPASCRVEGGACVSHACIICCLEALYLVVQYCMQYCMQEASERMAAKGESMPPPCSPWRPVVGGAWLRDSHSTWRWVEWHLWPPLQRLGWWVACVTVAWLSGSSSSLLMGLTSHRSLRCAAESAGTIQPALLQHASVCCERVLCMQGDVFAGLLQGLVGVAFV